MPFLCPTELVGGHALVTFSALVFPHLHTHRCVCFSSGFVCLCKFAPENVQMTEGNVPLSHGVRHGGGEADFFDFG